MKSSIIDVPRKPSQADLFGIQVYQDALIKYIRLTDTPITIALQGEWGSGKTSLMNQLRYNLCDQEGAPYFAVWINTWQFSLMKTPQQAIISILEGIINQIGQLNPNKHKWEESKRKIGGVFKKMATIGTKVAAGVVGVEGDRPSRPRRARWNSLATARWTTPSAWRTRTSLSAATGRPPARGSLRSSRSSSTWPAPGTESG